jgi:hypothetical protein
MRRLTLAFCLLVAIAATSCGGKPASAPPPAVAGGASSANKPCPNDLPFAAGYLPPGFSNQRQPGPAAGKPSLKNVTIFHYTGGGGQYIEMLRGGRRGILNASVGMIVLNHRATIGPLNGGTAINFRLGAARCGIYQIVTNIPDPHARELVNVGHGLRATASPSS